VDKPTGHYASEISQAQKDNYSMITLTRGNLKKSNSLVFVRPEGEWAKVA
jgi:hypothetical protein